MCASEPEKKAVGYEITATLGPASASEDLWRALIAAGATAFRLNTSHLSLEDLDTWLARLQDFFVQQQAVLPVVLDLQGSKWRLGIFTPFRLEAGEIIRLEQGVAVEQSGILPVPHADFFAAAQGSDGEIVLNDAKTRLQIQAFGAGWIEAIVRQGGEISPHKGITFASTTFRQEHLSEKDQAIVKQAAGLDFIRCAISYIRDAEEARHFRTQADTIYAPAGRKAYLIAKLERQPAVAEAAAISAWFDELWLCRGDLGAELGIPEMAAAAYRLTCQVRELPVPVILAGQVLEHMTSHPAPTRSEIYTIYDALARGYRGLVLSDEVAVGLYPVESCRAAALFQPDKAG